MKEKISQWAKTMEGAKKILPGKRKARSIAHEKGLTPHSGESLNKKAMEEFKAEKHKAKMALENRKKHHSMKHSKEDLHKAHSHMKAHGG